MRILILDELLPDARFGAGFPRAAEVLRVIVAAGWQATVYPMRSLPDEYVELIDRFPVGVRFLRGYGEEGLLRMMRDSIGRFDAVLISRPTLMARVARISAALPAFMTSAYCIYDAEAAFTEREWQRRKIFGPPMSRRTYDAELDAEVAVAGGVRAIVSVTEAEADLFRTRTSATVHVIGHTTPIRPDPPAFEGRQHFLFVGKSIGDRTESPNVDSLVWFVEEIMPLLDTYLGSSYRLQVAGKVDDLLVARLSSPRVSFAGVVDDLLPLYDRSRVFIAPTRYAAGLPLKVVEAAAAGIPCVVTDLLATQLAMRDGVECMVGTDAAMFARRCAALYSDVECWMRIRDAARARVSVAYSHEAFAKAVRHLLNAAAPLNAALVSGEANVFASEAPKSS